MDSGGFSATCGTSYVTVAAAGVTIVNGILTSPSITVSGSPFTISMNLTDGFKCVGNGVTLQINNNTAVLGTYASFNIFTTANSTERTLIAPGILQTQSSAGQGWATVQSNSSGGAVFVYDTTGTYNCYIDAGTGVVFARTSLSSLGNIKVNNSEVINSSKQFVGAGALCTGGAGGFQAINIYQSGWYYGVTGPTTFTTVDGKTVTVRGGAIVSIV